MESNFWDNYVKACDIKGVTPTKGMKDMGISTGNIYRWQNGGTPTGEMLITLAKYFRCTTDFFLFGEERNQHDSHVTKSAAEYTILCAFRELTPGVQHTALTYMKALADACITIRNEGEGGTSLIS